MVVPLWKRQQRHFCWVTGMAFATQAGVYLLNKETALVDLRFPATLVWWPLPARALGMYFGSHDQEFEWVPRNHRLSIFVLAAVGLGGNRMLGLPVNTYPYNAAHWLLTTTFALMRFGLAHSCSRGQSGSRNPWLSGQAQPARLPDASMGAQCVQTG